MKLDGESAFVYGLDQGALFRCQAMFGALQQAADGLLTEVVPMKSNRTLPDDVLCGSTLIDGFGTGFEK